MTAVSPAKRDRHSASSAASKCVPACSSELDADNNGQISREEFAQASGGRGMRGRHGPGGPGGPGAMADRGPDGPPPGRPGMRRGFRHGGPGMRMRMGARMFGERARSPPSSSARTPWSGSTAPTSIMTARSPLPSGGRSAARGVATGAWGQAVPTCRSLPSRPGNPFPGRCWRAPVVSEPAFFRSYRRGYLIHLKSFLAHWCDICPAPPGLDGERGDNGILQALSA